jgi:hypothetical protein
MKMKYYYPLPINAKFNALALSDSGRLRKITDGELEKFFGIKNREMDQKFRLTSVGNAGGGILPVNFLADSIVWGTSGLFSSNYVFETEAESEVVQFNQAIKLCFPGKSGLHIGFNMSAPLLRLLWPSPYLNVLEYSKITDRKDCHLLKDCFNRIKGIPGDNKLSLLFDLYLNALSGGRERLESKYLGLMTILELLYLPDGKTELKLRLSLRLAWILSLYNKANRQQVFDLMNSKNGLYSIRSDIAHTGKSKSFCLDRFQDMARLVSCSMLLYIKDKMIFSGDNLRNVLIAGSGLRVGSGRSGRASLQARGRVDSQKIG